MKAFTLVSLIAIVVTATRTTALVAPSRSSAFTAATTTTTAAASPVFGILSASDRRQADVAAVTRTTTTPTMSDGASDRQSPFQTVGPAVLDRPDTNRQGQPSKERKYDGGEQWEVRIFNDGLNTREYVARSLVKVVGISELNAYQTMMKAHKTGVASVGQWAFEVAELYHEGLQKNGIVSELVPVDQGS